MPFAARWPAPCTILTGTPFGVSQPCIDRVPVSNEITLVTGATGHVGANVIRELASRGHRLRVLVRESGPALDGIDAERVNGDVLEAASLGPALEGVDKVIHLAAKISIVGDPDGSVHRTNVEGTRNMVEAAMRAGVGRFVYCASVHGFDHTTDNKVISETCVRVPYESTKYAAYDRSKAHAEATVRSYLDKGLDAVIVHPSGVIGPHDYRPSRMGKVFLDLHRGSLPALVSGGYDFVDARDVSVAIAGAAEKGRKGESYILSGHHAPVAQLASIAAGITGRPSPRISCPMWLARAVAPVMETSAKLLKSEPLYTAESLFVLRSGIKFDNSKAQAELDFKPRSLEESIQEIYDCFWRRGVLPRQRAAS